MTGPSGSKVVVPAGALGSAVDIKIAETSTGAPSLPTGVTAAGAMFAFTPHGTSFATPVTISVPFDPSLVPTGSTPVLYKTNSTQTGWEVVAGATVSGTTMSGNVTGFSYVVPAVSLFSDTDKTFDMRLRYYNQGVEVLDHAESGARSVLGPLPDGTVGAPLNGGGTLALKPAGYPGTQGTAAVFATSSGRVFGTIAVAPLNVNDPTELPPYGRFSSKASAKLEESFFFRVNRDHPTLKFTITHAAIEALAYGGKTPSSQTCPWYTQLQINDPASGAMASCISQMMMGDVDFELSADVLNTGTFFKTGGALWLFGMPGYWDVYTAPLNGSRLWRDTSFDINRDVDRDGGRHFKVDLVEPKVVDIPIDDLKAGDEFSVTVKVQSSAQNAIQGEESFIAAALRDPLQDVGIDISSTSLTQIPPVAGIPHGYTPVPCTTGVDPAAGTLRFTSAAFQSPEGSGRALVVVERTGGSKGEVIARIASRDGTAIAGKDYLPLDTEVRFADGEDGPIAVAIELLDDEEVAPSAIANLDLTLLGGCAQTASPSTATFTLLNDDAPPQVPDTHTIGGTVTGLVGSGLVLREAINGGTASPGNGAFTLSGALADGIPYLVEVQTQPGNPAQQCTVTNGSGTITGADVTNVQVTCTSLAPSGSLDAGFGSGGRVVTSTLFSPAITGSPVSIARQSDGRILLLGGLKLLRFNADGTADTSFGVGGTVALSFKGSALDTAVDMLVLADGRILIAGTTNSGGLNDDFALLRLDSNGALDPTFGTGGKVSTDFEGSTDRAHRLRLQADGKILVAGNMTHVPAPNLASQNFGLVRYNTDGSLDSTFGSGGLVYGSAGGKYNADGGLAVQPNGRIVLAGLTANDGVTDPDAGLLRFCDRSIVDVSGTRDCNAGWSDPSFGLPDSVLGEYTGAMKSDFTKTNFGLGWQEAVDVVPLSDSRFLLAARVPFGAATSGQAFEFVTADCEEHSCLLRTRTSFTGESDSPRRMLQQSDGKIVIVGRVGEATTNPDMGIVRFSADGGLDADFGASGKLTIDFFGGIDSAEAVLQQPDGKLVIGGYARQNGQTVLAMVRLMP